MGLIPRRAKQFGLLILAVVMAFCGGWTAVEDLPWMERLFLVIALIILCCALVGLAYCYVYQLGPWQVELTPWR